MLTLDKFEEATEVVKKVILKTNLVYSDYLSEQTGNKVYLKPENMQFTGAYKVRGAYYKISTLTDEERAKGLITASAGNHAQGVAYAAKLYGAKATIVMPTTTPLMKVNRTKSYGAEVILYGDVYDEACDYAYKLAEEKGEPPFLFILDGIEDPHNLGAIIRTANLAGAHGVIIPKRRAVGLTSTVAKTSAGALNYTPVAKVTNISATIEELKERGLWFVCADMGGESMYRLDLKGPIGLVIGNEGEGVSRLVREKCDFIASIPMKGDIDSLNASVAAGVLAYEIVRQRMM